MRNVALLLDDSRNLYQQLLVRETVAAAKRSGVAVRPPRFADGSPWGQVGAINDCLRQPAPPDAVILTLAGGEAARGPVERVPRAGIPLVLLNRLPEWLPALRARYPEVLVSGVAPRQEWIGRVQARQAARLLPPGATVVLVTGTTASVAAVERRQGFLDEADGRFAVHELDGGWSSEGAEKALTAWFHFSAGRTRVPQLVACQNDAMADGARAALVRQAERTHRPDLARVPLLGCDGLEEEGRARVVRGELTATVVMPATTPPALEALRGFWNGGPREELVLLDSESYPALEDLQPVEPAGAGLKLAI